RGPLVAAYATIYTDYHFSAVGYNGWISGIWLLPGDELTESRGANTFFELVDGSLNPNNSTLHFAFSSAYKVIAGANVMIDRISNVDESVLRGAEEVAMMEHEELFPRAYQYFRVFNILGSIPFVTEHVHTAEERSTPQSAALAVPTRAITRLQSAL